MSSQKNTQAFLCTYLPPPHFGHPKKKKSLLLHTYVCRILEVGCHTCLKYNESLSSRHPWIPNTPCRILPGPPPFRAFLRVTNHLPWRAPAKSLTLSEMTGAKKGKSPEMQPRSEEHDGEYGAVNKETQPYTHSSLLLALLLPPLLCFSLFFLSSLGFLKKTRKRYSEGESKETVKNKV